jgi:hypothetical protein
MQDEEGAAASKNNAPPKAGSVHRFAAAREMLHSFCGFEVAVCRKQPRLQ